MATYVYDAVNDKLNLVAGATLYADVGVGSIIAFAGKEINLPEGYLAFNGQTVKRGDYPDLWAFAVANEQVGVDKFFSQGDGSTTFTLADLRETSLKGYGKTSRTVGAHVKSGGLGIGEFIDDRLQDHTHNWRGYNNIQEHTGTSSQSRSRQPINTDPLDETTGSVSSVYRSGLTTEVKAVGVVWAVKARQTGLPIDLKAEVLKVTTLDYSTRQYTAPQNFTATKHMRMNFLLCTSTSNVGVQVNGISVGVLDNTVSGEWILTVNLDLYPGDVVTFSLSDGRLELIDYKA